MLVYAVIFFILAGLAAVFGFGGAATKFADLAKFFSLIFIILFLVSLFYTKLVMIKNSIGGIPILNYAVLFLILAVLAGVLGFGGLASSFIGIAKTLALIFVVLFVVSVVYAAIVGRKTPQ
jgi:uncharacterized membrane protein YtjA (UPF0391 family)